MLEKEGPETPLDAPLLERSNAAVKVLIRTGKKRGYVTHDQINSLAKEVNSEQIEDILAMFNEMGINVVESEEAETEEATEPPAQPLAVFWPPFVRLQIVKSGDFPSLLE